MGWHVFERCEATFDNVIPDGIRDGIVMVVDELA